MALKVAAVSRDGGARMELARAFDAAPPSWEVALYDFPPDDADVVVLGPDVEGATGIVFDPRHPQDMLDAVGRAARFRTGAAVLIAGSGGGVGVTSVALHLARCASRSGSACYVELGSARGAAARLGIEPGARTWGDAGSGDGLGSSALPVAGGFRVSLAPESPAADGRDVIERATSEFERVILDAAPGSDLPALRTGVLVTTACPTSIERTRAILDRHDGIRWAIVINRLGAGGEITSSDVQRLLEKRIALELPCSPALRDAEDDCRLLTQPIYRWSRAIERLWRALERA